MPKKSATVMAETTPAQGSAGLSVLPLNRVVDPALPARESMDEAKFADLKSSMAELGLLSPIIAVRRGEVYEVVAGHRRVMAARELGWLHIPATVHEDGWAAAEAAMLHENVVREDLNAGEEAVFLAQLIEKYQLDEDGICSMVKRTPDYVADRLRLVRGDPEVLNALRRGQISFAVARELNKFTDETMRRYFLDSAIRSGCSSRVVTGWLTEWRSQQAAPAAEARETQGAVEQAPPPAYVDECFLCGGARDPYNLVTVRVHRWELEEIRKSIAKAAEGGA